MSTATNVTTKPYIVRLRERGQITLPAQLREELGVGVGISSLGSTRVNWRPWLPHPTGLWP
jgi:hypothetical protein